MISIIPFGDRALLINFEQRIDRNIHQQVLALHHALEKTEGIRFMIPAYCSLTIAFDPQIITTSALHKRIHDSFEETVLNTHLVPGTSHRVLDIPVCYDPEFSPDLEEVSRQTGKSIDDILDAHLNIEFYVYMLGFMPGFAYMGDMPEELCCQRKSTPRTRVPAESVGLAGTQTGIYPFESPGGWQIIGRTPVKIFDAAKEEPGILRAGDIVKFRKITKEIFIDIKRMLGKG